MEIKDSIALAAVLVAATGVLVTWLKYRHDVRVRQEDLEPRDAKPFANVTHTVTSSSISPDTHTLKLEISNRDDGPIAVKEVFWHVKSFRTRWPMSFTCTLLPETNALPQHKIETADLLRLDVDIQDVFKPLLGSKKLHLLDTIIAVSSIEIRVILTTGECISLSTPWTFRSYLASEHIRSSWLAQLIKFYVWARP
jgi:hypothetical protein